jgi:hypothetical protein
VDFRENINLYFLFLAAKAKITKNKNVQLFLKKCTSQKRKKVLASVHIFLFTVFGAYDVLYTRGGSTSWRVSQTWVL